MVADLELLRVAVEFDLGDLLADRVVPVLEVLEVPVWHAAPTWLPAQGCPGRAPLSRCPARSRDRNALKLGQMSSLRSISTDEEVVGLEPAEHVEHRALVVVRAERLDLAVAEQVADLAQLGHFSA